VQVRVPGSSANLGPGFDALALAVDRHLTVGFAPFGRSREAEANHPALVAFRRAGGSGPLWVESSLPSGRGLGFSGAARAAGVVAAGIRDGLVDRDALVREAFPLAAALDGHADNVAASLVGGVVATADGRVVSLPFSLDAAVVVWVPRRSQSTATSRRLLAREVSFDDAVRGIGRAVLMTAALAAGDRGALAVAWDDCMHTPHRLQRLPSSRDALEVGRAAGAWAGWLSGAGPAVAFLCDPDDAAGLAAALATGAAGVDVRAIDRSGLQVLMP
jgi:homoserine kinase